MFVRVFVQTSNIAMMITKNIRRIGKTMKLVLELGTMFKQVSYSVIKIGLIGLTRYLAKYWTGKFRWKVLCPGGAITGFSKEFLNQVVTLVPMDALPSRMSINREFSFDPSL